MEGGRAGHGVALAVLRMEGRAFRTLGKHSPTAPRPSPRLDVSCQLFEGRSGFLCSPLRAGHLVINTRLSSPLPNVLPCPGELWRLSFNVACVFFHFPPGTEIPRGLINIIRPRTLPWKWILWSNLGQRLKVTLDGLAWALSFLGRWGY